jgi:RNA polymerase sigma-70 factor (ECF subfamily)
VIARPKALQTHAADLTPTLVVRLREGHDQAGQLLHELYWERLVGFCLRYVGSRDTAEDVVQDAFCKVLESPTVPEVFRAWIYRICRNRCLDLQRAARRHGDETLPTGSFLAEDEDSPLSRMVDDEQRAHLRELVATLPEDQREVLMLRYVEGLSRAEAAEVLGISDKLVKSRLYHGLERLRLHRSLRDG